MESAELSSPRSQKMKITITINGAEIVFEPQTPQEVKAAGVLIKELVGASPTNTKTATPDRAGRQKTSESELNLRRGDEIAFVLETNRFPMNAPEIAQEIKGLEPFQTKSGDPVHIVRRILASDERFQKTISGLFTLKSRVTENDEEAEKIAEETADYPHPILFTAPPPAISRNYRPPADDDMDDPFADN